MTVVRDKENIIHGTNVPDHTRLKVEQASVPAGGFKKTSLNSLSLEHSEDTSLFEETERLRQENSVLEEELQQVNAEVVSVQEEAFANEELLLQRISFLSQELEAQEADSSEAITQLDCELRSVAVALDRVTIERDNLSEALMDAAREKVSALVKVAELSGLMHHALKKLESDEPGTEPDLAQNELLTRFQATIDDKLSLQFRLQDVESSLFRVQTRLAGATEEREIEDEHVQLLSSLLDNKEVECTRLTAQNQQQAATISELRAIVQKLEQDDRSKDNDVHAMAKHLNHMRARLEDLQEQAKLQQDSHAAAELELREMFEERIMLLQRQMDLIGELASSEFSMIGMNEELDASKQANDSLRSENGMLSRECERLLYELRRTWQDGGEAVDQGDCSLSLTGTAIQARSHDEVQEAAEIEEGEIVSLPASPDAAWKTSSKVDCTIDVLAETENIPSNGEICSMLAKSGHLGQPNAGWEFEPSMSLQVENCE